MVALGIAAAAGAAATVSRPDHSRRLPVESLGSRAGRSRPSQGEGRPPAAKPPLRPLPRHPRGARRAPWSPLARRARLKGLERTTCPRGLWLEVGGGGALCAQSPAELRVLSSETDSLDQGYLCVLPAWAGRLVQVKEPRGRRSGPVASSQASSLLPGRRCDPERLWGFDVVPLLGWPATRGAAVTP